MTNKYGFMNEEEMNLPYNWGRSLMAVWKQQNADAYWKTKKGKNFLKKELLYMV